MHLGWLDHSSVAAAAPRSPHRTMLAHAQLAGAPAAVAGRPIRRSRGLIARQARPAPHRSLAAVGGGVRLNGALFPPPASAAGSPGYAATNPLRRCAAPAHARAGGAAAHRLPTSRCQCLPCRCRARRTAGSSSMAASSRGRACTRPSTRVSGRLYGRLLACLTCRSAGVSILRMHVLHSLLHSPTLRACYSSCRPPGDCGPAG